MVCVLTTTMNIYVPTEMCVCVCFGWKRLCVYSRKVGDIGKGENTPHFPYFPMKSIVIFNICLFVKLSYHMPYSFRLFLCVRIKILH